MSLRVLFAGGGTGGHLVPALRLAEQLLTMRPDAIVHFAGSARGFEEPIVAARGWDYTGIPARGFYRRRPWRNVMTVIAGVRSVAAARRLVKSFRPDLAIGTGGYASAFPIRACVRAGVPVFLQEQNRKPGLATRHLARRARKVFLAYAESGEELPAGVETRLCGNPVDPSLGTMSVGDARREWGIAPEARVILVTGGSGGAQSINRNIMKSLGSGDGDGTVLLWQTGRSFDEAVPDAAGWDVRRFEFSDRMSAASCAADVVVARAGALTLAEICAAGKPSVLVPYPHATDDHQTINARALVDAGAAELVLDGELDRRDLLAEARTILDDDARCGTMADAARGLGRPSAARDILEDILSSVGSSVGARGEARDVG